MASSSRSAVPPAALATGNSSVAGVSAWAYLVPHFPGQEIITLHAPLVTVGSAKAAKNSGTAQQQHVRVTYDPFLSRAHFELRRTPAGEVRVTALSKTNKTFLNGLQLAADDTRTALPDGDNAAYQPGGGVASDAPIIFATVPNRKQALSIPAHREGFCGFSLVLHPSPHAASLPAAGASAAPPAAALAPAAAAAPTFVELIRGSGADGNGAKLVLLVGHPSSAAPTDVVYVWFGWDHTRGSHSAPPGHCIQCAVPTDRSAPCAPPQVGHHHPLSASEIAGALGEVGAPAEWSK